MSIVIRSLLLVGCLLGLSPRGRAAPLTTIERIAASARAEVVGATEVTFLTNAALFEKKIQMLRSARQYFYGSVFIVRCDPQTMRLFDLMEKKVRAGVDVRLLIDWMGDFLDDSDCRATLEKKGITVARVMSSRTGLLRELSADFGERKSTAMHAKIWVSDGREALVDGTNLMNLHVVSTESNFMYKDAGLHVRGPVVSEIARRLLQLWEEKAPGEGDAGKLMRFRAGIEQRVARERDRGLRGSRLSAAHAIQTPCVFATQDPARGDYRASALLLEQLRQAKQNLFFSPLETEFRSDVKFESYYKSFYRMLDEKIRYEQLHVYLYGNQYGTWSYQERFPRSRFRDHGTGFLGGQVNARYREYFRERGYPRFVQVARSYRKVNPSFHAYVTDQFNHSKVLVTDDRLVTVGSHNMNDRSFISDIESMLVCDSPALASEVEGQFVRDAQSGREIR